MMPKFSRMMRHQSFAQTHQYTFLGPPKKGSDAKHTDTVKMDSGSSDTDHESHELPHPAETNPTSSNSVLEIGLNDELKHTRNKTSHDEESGDTSSGSSHSDGGDEKGVCFSLLFLIRFCDTVDTKGVARR